MHPTIGSVQARWASHRWGGSLDGGFLRWHFSREAHRDVILPCPGICFVEAENTAGMKLSLWRTRYSPICMKKTACVALSVLLYLVYMESASNTMYQNKLGSFFGRRKICFSSNFHSHYGSSHWLFTHRLPSLPISLPLLSPCFSPSLWQISTSWLSSPFRVSSPGIIHGTPPHSAQRRSKWIRTVGGSHHTPHSILNDPLEVWGLLSLPACEIPVIAETGLPRSSCWPWHSPSMLEGR